MTSCAHEQSWDIVVVGGGPAGLAAAVAAHDAGCRSILILERDRSLGGILKQCIHTGFGLQTFKEELTGPEYAARYVDMVRDRSIECRLDTMVLDINPDKTVTAVSAATGLYIIHARAIVLAMGCRERPRGALNIPGFRPAGIFSAGCAQRLVNIEGYMPGKKVVILGSGDIGLIMARRMVLEGASVEVVAELMPYSSGLKRNIVQCLDDFGIELKYRHTAVDIKGKYRLGGVTVAEVDQDGRPIAGTEIDYECDTLLLSVGLIPENELSREAGVNISPLTSGPIVNESLETNIEGVFACGNVLHVHDLVDYVSQEAEMAGLSAAGYVMSGGMRTASAQDIPIVATGGVRYTVPFSLNPTRMQHEQVFRFRVGGVYRNCFVSVYFNDQRVIHCRRRIVTPGEMEEVTIGREQVLKYKDIRSITFKIEQE